MQEMGFEQNPKSANPHRKELSGVLTWVCKQSVKICILRIILMEMVQIPTILINSHY